MTENTEYKEVLDKAKELESIDFTNKDVSLDYNEYYDAISKIANKNNNFKQEEAETIISEVAPKMIDQSFVDELSKKRETIVNYIRYWDPNTDKIKEMSRDDISKIYVIFNYLMNSYITYVNEMTFDFVLENAEYKFLEKVLNHEVEYDGDEVFNFTEFVETFWEKAAEEYQKDKTKDSYTFKIDIKKILLLHHLIKNHKVKGISSNFKTFRNILYKIAQTNRVFNAYNIIIERLKDDSKLWGTALDAIVDMKDGEKTDSVTLGDVTVSEVTKEDLG